MSRWIIYRSNFLGTQLDSIDQFDPTDVFYIRDVFYTHHLTEVFDKKGLPGCVVNDHYATAHDVVPHDIPLYTAPFFLENCCPPCHYIQLDDVPNTLHTANFVVKKPQINRYLTVKLVELFGIDSIYTLSQTAWAFDMTNTLNELATIDHSSWLSQEHTNFLLAPATMQPHILENYQDIADHEVVNVWVSGLNDVYQHSAVALITESLNYQRGAVFTEKTLFPMVALNFPIWVGGYGQADEWQRCGFDIFDDVIDHSYQYMPTLIERCWWAFKLNIELLQNKDLAAAARVKHLSRLKQNRQLILDNHLKDHNDQVVKSWPIHVQSQVIPWLEAFREIYKKPINIQKEPHHAKTHS